MSSLDFKNLKDLDVDQLTENLLNKKVLIANILIVAIFLFIGKTLFDRFVVIQGDYQKQVGLIEAKIGIIKRLSLAEAELKAYVAKLPRSLDEDNFFVQISEFATQAGVQVQDLSPSSSKSEELFNSVGLKIKLEAKDYKSILKFVHHIEGPQYALRLESIKISFANSAQGKNAVSADLELVGVRIK